MKAIKSILAVIFIITCVSFPSASCSAAKTQMVKTIDKTVYLYTKTLLPFFDGGKDGCSYSYSVSDRECVKVKDDGYTEYCTQPLVIGKKPTKGHIKPVITIYRKKKGEGLH